MHTYSRGHHLTTDSAQAATACSAAIDRFVKRQIDAVPSLQNSISADPQCAFTQALFGLMLHGARNASLCTQIQAALHTAQAHKQNCTERERQYINALECACKGDLLAMVGCYEQILEKNPTDLLALTLAQGELFWLGDMHYAEKLPTDSMANGWQSRTTGFVLSDTGRRSGTVTTQRNNRLIAP